MSVPALLERCPLLHSAPNDIRFFDAGLAVSRAHGARHHGPMELPAAMVKTGHLVSRQQLASVRIGRHSVDRGIREGALLPVRRGWVATPQANQLAIIATLHGARLTGATALRTYGIWAGDDRRIHLQLPPNAHRVQQRPLTPIASFASPKFAPQGVVNHWGVTSENSPGDPTRAARATRASQPLDNARLAPHPVDLAIAQATLAPCWRVSLADAVIRFGGTETDEQLLAAIESAVHEELLSRSAAIGLFQLLPRRQRRLAAKLNFQGESGMETIVRLRLELLGLRLMQQVWIGKDRVDLVIDGWLIVELDGDEWHDPVTDRIRTNRLIRAGYRVLRFGYAEVFDHWDETVATILEMLGLHPSV